MMNWQAATTTFLIDHEGLTHRRYADALTQFHTWYIQTYHCEPEVALLTVEELRAYRQYLSGERHYQAATINLHLAALRGLLRCHGRNLRLKGVKLVAPAVEALDARALGRLLAAVDGPDWQDKRNVALLNVLARAGLRISEALSLNIGDVQLGDRGGVVLIRQGKGGKERSVALPKEARAALRAYLAVRPQAPESKLLFLSRSWQALGARDVQRLLAAAAQRAGLTQKITPHTLRHTYATRFLQAGGDIATLAQLLGHSSVATTTRYLHPDAGRVQEMVEEL